MANPDLLAEALQHHQAGRLADARALYQGLLDADPDDADALNYLGVLECQQRRLARAEELISRSIALRPENPKAHNNLGNVLRYLGRLADAEAAFRRAMDLDPEDAGARFNCATVLLDQGRAAEARPLLRQAVVLAPDDARFAQGLAVALAGREAEAADGETADDLMHVLAFDAVDTTPLRRVATVAIMARPAVAGPLARMEDGDDLDDAGLAALTSEPLLERYMACDILVDPLLERLLSGARRRLLAGGGAGNDDHAFLAALARQCFLNEYVFAETAGETDAVEALERRLAEGRAAGGTPPARDLLLLACYRPLHATALGDALAKDPGALADDAAVAAVLRLQVAEPMQERAIMDTLARLTPVRDAVSAAVRKQYEENPYPRWRRLAPVEPLPLGLWARRRFPFLERDAADWPAEPRILVAGAGTGREPIMRRREYEDASVTAVDLSRASLAYGARMAKELGAADIEFAEADILELGPLDRRFDLVFSSGVLHHLADPVAGWRVLTGLLAEGGLMSVGLYSEHARAAVVAAREFVAAGGYPADADGIRRCRRDIVRLSADHPARGVLATADFYTASACRDLIFHVQEHRFTIDAIADALDVLGLRFLGFETRPSVEARYRERFPSDPTMTDLGNWARVEADDPSVFWNMYQFWVTKD